MKNFFNNILRFQLKDKFNFSSFEAFSGLNCIKIVDKIKSEFDEAAAIKKLQDEHKKLFDEWAKQKQEHEDKENAYIQKLKEEWSNKDKNEDIEEHSSAKGEKTEEKFEGKTETEKSEIVENGTQKMDKKETQKQRQELNTMSNSIQKGFEILNKLEQNIDTNPETLLQTLQLQKEEKNKIINQLGESTENKCNKSSESNGKVEDPQKPGQSVENKEKEEATESNEENEILSKIEQLITEYKEENKFNLPKPKPPFSEIRVRLYQAVHHCIDKQEQTLELQYSQDLAQFPTLEGKSETPQLNLEIMLAPLQTLEVCQLFQKIIYVKQNCPKSSFSPSEPILLYGFSLYGPFPNPVTASAFKFTFKVANTRTNEVQILRASVYDQKEKFYKFFLTNPMYVDSKDFVNIVCIENRKELNKFELGLNKKLIDPIKWYLEAYKDFREESAETEVSAIVCCGDGAVFVLSSENPYFYGSDGVRFCVGNHYYQSVGSIYYEKVAMET